MKKTRITRPAVLAALTLFVAFDVWLLWVYVLKPADVPLPPAIVTILNQAAHEKKAALIHFGTQWCGACRELDAFLEEVDIAQIIEQYYVVAEVDLDSMEGAEAVAKRWQRDDFISMPLTAIVSSTGKVLATSKLSASQDKFQRNIGFPSADPGITHFIDMLRATSAISDDELAHIEAQLRARAERVATAT